MRCLLLRVQCWGQSLHLQLFYSEHARLFGQRLICPLIVEVPPSTRHPEQRSGFPPWIRPIGLWAFPACALACDGLSAHSGPYRRG